MVDLVPWHPCPWTSCVQPCRRSGEPRQVSGCLIRAIWALNRLVPRQPRSRRAAARVPPTTTVEADASAGQHGLRQRGGDDEPVTTGTTPTPAVLAVWLPAAPSRSRNHRVRTPRTQNAPILDVPTGHRAPTLDRTLDTGRADIGRVDTERLDRTLDGWTLTEDADRVTKARPVSGHPGHDPRGRSRRSKPYPMDGAGGARQPQDGSA
jgi:hypothetical protein